MIAATKWQNRARGCVPGLRLDDEVLRATDKAVLLGGTLAGTDVVAKLLVDDDGFWHTKFAAEIDTYRAFDLAGPPVPVPRMLAADPDAGVLVVTRLPGQPVSTDRYPMALRRDQIRVMLKAAQLLRDWSAPREVFPVVWDYPHRFQRYRTEYGLLDASDEAALNALTSAAGPMRLAHGDLLPSNVLQTPGGALAGVLDWEFAGRFLPGLDLALLWLVLGRLPGVRDDVEHLAGDSGPQWAGFWANVATLCVRELRTHGEWPDDPVCATRLPYLRASWATVRARVRELAGAL
jgi:aminoglycoside phosphotransferase (APT) family kinase protein